MTQLAFKMKLKPGVQQEYKKRHDEIWPELVDLLKNRGIRDYFIFVDEETNCVFGTFGIDDPELISTLGDEHVMREWWKFMKDLMTTHDDNSPVSIPLQKMFHLP